MRPVLFAWRGLTLRSYPLMLYLGLLAGIVAGHDAARRAGLDPVRSYLAMLALVGPGLLGARLLFVATHRTAMGAQPHTAARAGGAAVWGALLSVLLLSVPLLAALGLPLAVFWDVATVPLLLAALFGRAGCLLHGCCGGRPLPPRAARFLPGRLGRPPRRVPTQALEFAWVGALLTAVAAGWGAPARPGVLFLAALAAYAAGRLVLDVLRDDRDTPSALRARRGLSAAALACSASALVLLWSIGQPA